MKLTKGKEVDNKIVRGINRCDGKQENHTR